MHDGLWYRSAEAQGGQRFPGQVYTCISVVLMFKNGTWRSELIVTEDFGNFNALVNVLPQPSL